MLITGTENTIWWGWSTIGCLLFGSSIFVTTYRANLANDLNRTGRLLTLLLALGCTAFLAWLGLYRATLIHSDAATLGLVTVLFSLISTGLVFYFLRLKVLSFPIIFLGVTFIFTSSPLILYQSERANAFQYWRTVNLQAVIEGMPLVMLAFSSFLLGALFLTPVNNKRGDEKTGRIIYPGISDRLRQIGYFTYIVSMVLIILVSLRGGGLSLAVQGGYHGFTGGRKTGVLAGIIPILLSRFLPWAMLILTGTSRTRRAYIQTWLLAIPAFGLMFMAGDRTAPCCLLLLMAASGYILGMSIDWKKSFAVIGLVILLVPTIVNLRRTPIKNWSVELLIKAVTNQVEGTRQYDRSAPSATLIAMSTSYQTLMGTLMLVPDHESYRYGLDYLRSAGMIVPFTTTFYSFLGIDIAAGKPSEWVRDFLDPTSDTGTGFLQLAEAYLQFGVFGIIGLYGILGVALPRLWWYLRDNDIDSRKLTLVLFVMDAVINWVRNDSIGVARAAAWGWVFVYWTPTILDKFLSLRTHASQMLAVKLANSHRRLLFGRQSPR
jgi:O-antigen polysaccharide polymerase Wzy-like protein